MQITEQEHLEIRSRMYPMFHAGGEAWFPLASVLRPVQFPRKGRDPEIEPGALSKALKESGAKLAMWTYDFDGPAESPWWWVVCDDRTYDIAKFSKKVRQATNRGLRRCEVHRVETTWFAEHGYPCYAACVAHRASAHDGILFQSLEQFRSRIQGNSQCRGYEVWVAMVGERIAAFVTCYNIEGVILTAEAKSAPELHSCYPNNALYYVVARHYLLHEGAKYITGGHRSLLHPTQVEDFKEKMGYRRCYARLGVMLGAQANMVVGLGLDRLGKRLSGLPGKVGRFGRQLGALNQAVSISKACRELPAT